MFPSDLWVTDPNAGKLFKVENDMVTMSIQTPKNPRSVLVSQDMLYVYTVNWDENTVSQYRQGTLVRDIKVGNIPYAICEDGNGYIYVTNYGDNTVTKISNGEVVDTINVPNGPRGIVADSRNKIFVACYLDDCVVEIVNNTMVNRIKTGYAPKALTCDIYDNVWVTNYGSNSISKITNGVKMLDIELSDYGRGPSAIVSNSAGILYVANYLGNNVTVIKDGAVKSTILVNASPTAIGVTADDSIYVLSEIGGAVSKINKDRVVSQINVCDNPSGFGDFTGCATYNVYHSVGAGGGSGSGSSSAPAGGWGLSSLSSDLRNLLTKLMNKKAETEARLVSFDNAHYPTVEDALNKLFKVPPVILNFSATNGVFEYGSTATSIQINWTFNKPMAKAVLKKGSDVLADLAIAPGDVIPATGTQVVSGFSLDTSTPITLEVTDDADNTTIKSIRIEFQNSFLYGALDESEAINQPSLASLRKSPLTDSPKGVWMEIDCADGKKPVLAFPALWHVEVHQIMFANGFTNEWKKETMDYVNGSGATASYDVFSIDRVMKGKFLVSVVDFI